MTKEKIIELVEQKFREELHWEEAIADELLALIEQEKKEEINNMLEEPRQVIYLDVSKPLYEECKVEIENAKREVAKEILNDISKEIRVEEDIHREEYHIFVYKEGVFRLMKKFKEKYGVWL